MEVTHQRKKLQNWEIQIVVFATTNSTNQFDSIVVTVIAKNVLVVGSTQATKHVLFVDKSVTMLSNYHILMEGQV
jgi:hypothetical protein